MTHMTTSNNPEELRTEIEQTRANLSQNVNALGEAVTPGAIARRQVDKVKGAGVGVKDKIMGSADDARSSVSGSASGLGDSAGNLAVNAQQSARRKTQGNPLAAGLIALGAGWLVGSLLPASEKERQAAATVKEKAQPVVSEAQSLAKDAAQNLQQPAQDAVDSVKATAQDAAETVKSEGQTAGQDVKSSVQDSKETVQQHQQRPDTSL
jgi:gas vesicle protein